MGGEAGHSRCPLLLPLFCQFRRRYVPDATAALTAAAESTAVLYYQHIIIPSLPAHVRNSDFFIASPMHYISVIYTYMVYAFLHPKLTMGFMMYPNKCIL